MTSIIKSTSLSHSAIVADIKADLEGVDGWSDWIESTNGKIFINWMAGLATYQAYHAMVNRFESSLELARLESSVVELAFNKGFLVPPTQGCKVKITYNFEDTTVISEGDLLGTLGKYDVYSLENYSASGLTEVYGTVGTKEEFTFSFTSLEEFTTLTVEPANRYVISELEQLRANNEIINMSSDIDFLNSIENNFVLRRLTPSEVHIYVGNGVLGWYSDTITEFVYRCVSYGSDILDVLTSTFNSLLPDNIDFVIDTNPTFSIPKETIRRTAMFYPLDGRAVQDNDYEALVMKYFAGYLYDAYSYNTDPHHEIVLLTNSSFTENVVTTISELIDKKRGLNIDIYYLLIPYTTKELIVTRGSGNYDNLGSYLLESVTSVYQGATIYSDYELVREGSNNRNYLNRIYWNNSSSPPEVGSTYTVKYSSTGVDIPLNLRIKEEYVTSNLLSDILTYLEYKKYLLMRDTTSISSIDLAVELTKEFGIAMFTEYVVTEVNSYNFIKQFNITITKI